MVSLSVSITTQEEPNLYWVATSIRNWLLSIRPLPWDPTQQFLNDYKLLLDIRLGKSMKRHVRRFARSIGLESVRDLEGVKIYLPALCPSDRLLDFVSSRDSVNNYVNAVLVKDRHSIQKGITQILDYLYLGSGLDASDTEALESLGIYRVLNVAQDWHGRNIENGLFKVEKIGLLDDQYQELIEPLYKAVEIIEDARKNGQKILVHCILGKSRSASIVLGYLMIQRKMPLNAAFELVKSRRPIIFPNMRFMTDLLRLEWKLFRYKTIDIQHYESQLVAECTADRTRSKTSTDS